MVAEEVEEVEEVEQVEVVEKAARPATWVCSETVARGGPRSAFSQHPSSSSATY